jgi:hypothetical protein
LWSDAQTMFADDDRKMAREVKTEDASRDKEMEKDK